MMRLCYWCKIVRKSLFPLVCLFQILLCSCSSEAGVSGDNDAADPDMEQVFYVAVESAGELFEVNDDGIVSFSRRPITSVTPKQTFDRLVLVIMENALPAKVVYRKEFNNWSSTDNKTSIPWSNEEGKGRYAEVRLKGSDCLSDDKSYMVYAVGYQSGTYSGYEPFKGVRVGDNFTRTEVVDAPMGVEIEEIFAGAGIFSVVDGKLVTRLDADSEYSDALVILRRQLAGTFGYFTHIPAMIDNVAVSKLRLVSTKRNNSLILGGFRSVEDPLNFVKENVINGMSPMDDYDTCLDGSDIPDAFTVYEIDLSKWFPGNTVDSRLPLDKNGDGFLDSGDSNWRINNERYPEGTVSLAEGTVFGDSFWFPLVMTANDINSNAPTFQMQIISADNKILKHWDVLLRDLEDDGEPRTIVSLPDGTEGRTHVEVVESSDTEMSYSVVRNRLYSMGEKNFAQDYGEDEPLNLGDAGVLVLDARHEWRIFDTVIFN